jgi:hypothetical protein
MLKRIAADKTFSQELLKPYDCPAYLVASRSLQLYCMEKAGRCIKKPRSASPLITGLWLPLQEPIVDDAIFQPLSDLIADCEQIWIKDVMEPLAMLDKALTSNANPNMNCKDVDAKWDAYLAKEKELYSNGVKAIQAEFQKQSPAVTNYIKYAMYSGIDEQDESASKSTDDFILDNVWIIGEIDRSFNRKRIRNKYYQSINALLLKGDRFKKRYKSTCNTEPDAELIPGDEDLVRYKVKTLECEYIKKVITPVRYKFVLHCNNITEETDPKLPKRKPDNQKGSAHNASRKNSTKGPVRSPRGPHISFDVNEDAEANYDKAPLTSENKDISQFSLEYNKWGNLVGFNFQLNEDGSGLKDPNSIESGVDSRWSWNAIGSAKKGYMNKLLMK